jgi:hypothetical protein
MPFRFLLPVARVLENHIAKKKIVYGRKLVKLLRPEFIVIYNGAANFPEKKTLCLSDAFEKVAGVDANLERLHCLCKCRKRKKLSEKHRHEVLRRPCREMKCCAQQSQKQSNTASETTS